ncbi:hypothetical protein AgCh_005277 [Apium graveolens]
MSQESINTFEEAVKGKLEKVLSQAFLTLSRSGNLFLRDVTESVSGIANIYTGTNAGNSQEELMDVAEVLLQMAKFIPKPCCLGYSLKLFSKF